MKFSGSIKPAIWITLFLDSAGLAIALPILPKLIEKLVSGNISLAASYYGLMLALAGVLLFFCGPLQAALSDHFGRKKMLVIASLGTAVSYLALAAAPNLFLLFVAQAVYAMTGASQPVASCYVADRSQPSERTNNFSLLSGVLTLGFIIGASVGGLLGQFGLNIAMVAASLTCLSAVVMTVLFFEDTQVTQGTHDCSTLSNFSDASDLHTRPSSKRKPLRLLGLLKANPIASSKFLFSRASLAEYSFIMICGDFAFQAFLSTWVLFATLRFHWTISQAGASLALEGLFSVVVQVLFLRWALPRLGVRKTLFASLLFDALALLLYNCVDGSLIVVGVIAMHCIGSAVKPTCSAALASAVTASEQAKLQGAIGSQYALSSVAASLLGTSLFSYFTSSVAPIVLPGISMLVGFMSLVAAMCVAALPYCTAVLSRKPASVTVLQTAQSNQFRTQF